MLNTDASLFYFFVQFFYEPTSLCLLVPVLKLQHRNGQGLHWTQSLHKIVDNQPIGDRELLERARWSLLNKGVMAGRPRTVPTVQSAAVLPGPVRARRPSIRGAARRGRGPARQNVPAIACEQTSVSARLGAGGLVSLHHPPSLASSRHIEHFYHDLSGGQFQTCQWVVLNQGVELDECASHCGVFILPWQHTQALESLDLRS